MLRDTAPRCLQMLEVLLKHVLTLGAVIAATSFPVVIQAATEIPAVVVSAARTEQSTLTTPASITVITREQIDASGARHVAEVLRGQGGVQINDFYGDGSRASVGMRGFGETAGSNTLVLVDGRRLNNPDIAAADLNSIALQDVELRAPSESSPVQRAVSACVSEHHAQ